MIKSGRGVTVAAIIAVAVVVVSDFGESTSAQTALEGDAKAGQTKAVTCGACHGQQGISSNALWPNLAGQQEAYLVKSMKDFRDGNRTEVTMQPFIKDLTDQDIADLAAYFAGLSPCP